MPNNTRLQTIGPMKPTWTADATVINHRLVSSEITDITPGVWAIVINEDDAYIPGPLNEATLEITSPAGDFQTIEVRATTVSTSEGGNLSFEF